MSIKKKLTTILLITAPILVGSLFTLIGCSNNKPSCSFAKANIEPVPYTDEERLEQCDLFYRVTFDKVSGKTQYYDTSYFVYYYTKYSVTINTKYKGYEDLQHIYLFIDLSGCRKSDMDQKVELHRQYDVYLKYSDSLKGYRIFDYMGYYLVN